MSELKQCLQLPEEIYPQLLSLDFYNSITTINDKYIVTAIESYKPVSDIGGKIATMAKIVLSLQDKTNKSSDGIQLKLIAKVVAESPAVLMSSREVHVYHNIIQPLLVDFQDHCIHDQPIISAMNNIFPTTFNNTLTQQQFITKFQSVEQFKAPYYYYGETNDKNGKLLLLGEIVHNAGHSGCFFGSHIPHNAGYDITPMVNLYPSTTQLDITKMAFSTIAKLHAKYWNNQHKNIPSYLPSYKWYYPSSNGDIKQANDEYNEFLSFGTSHWNKHLTTRIDDGLIVSDYFISIVDSMIHKSTWENFYQEYVTNPNKIPLSVIHCDYFPHNTLISSSNDCSGLVQSCSIKQPSEQIDSISSTNDNNATAQSTPLNPHFFIIDYEFTCVSSPAQDLSQWAIAQVNPIILEQNEDGLLQLYYQQLQYYYYLYQYQQSSPKPTQTTTLNNNAQDDQQSNGNNIQDFTQMYPFSSLKRDYITGFTKWVWLVLVSSGLIGAVPTSMLQFFINQIETFMKRHQITPESAPLFRR